MVLGLAFWWAGWGWGNSGGYFWGYGAGSRNSSNAATTSAPVNPPNGYGSPNTSVQQASGSGVQVLNASNKQTFVGKPFQANDVRVQNKVNNHVLWIGAKNGDSMLAVVKENGNPSANADVGQGKLVGATGTVEKAPPENQAKQEWSLSDQDASRLEQQGAYIQISQLTVPQQVQP